MESIDKRIMFKISAIEFKDGQDPKYRTIKLDLNQVLNLEASPEEVLFNYKTNNGLLIHLSNGLYMGGVRGLFTRNADKFLDELFEAIPDWWKVDSKLTDNPVCLNPRFYGLDANKIKKFDKNGKVYTVRQVNGG